MKFYLESQNKQYCSYDDVRDFCRHFNSLQKCTFVASQSSEKFLRYHSLLTHNKTTLKPITQNPQCRYSIIIANQILTLLMFKKPLILLCKIYQVKTS